MVELCIDGTSCQACDFELCCVSVRLCRQSWSHVGLAGAEAGGGELAFITPQASLHEHIVGAQTMTVEYLENV